MECLDEAEGFVKTSREDRFLACDRACKQVAHTLASLAQVWKVRPVAHIDYLSPRLLLSYSNLVHFDSR